MIRAFLLAFLWVGATQAASLPLTITFQQPASITLGETAILPTADGDNAGVLVANGPYTLTQASVLQSLAAYAATAAGHVRLGIYDATGSGGGPGALVAQTNSFVPVAGWNTRVTTTTPTLRPGNYWLAFNPDNNGLVFRTGTKAGVSTKWVARTFQALPAVFPASGNDVQGWSIYAKLAPTGPPGPLTVSFNPDSPSIPCEAPPGSTVSTVTATGGNGGPITWNMTGDTGNFKMNATPSVVSVIVGPSGVAPSDCGTTRSVDVTATQ